MKYDILDYAAVNFPCIVSEQSIELELSLPSINRLTLTDDVESYLKSCRINDQAMCITTNKQATIILNKLSAKLVSSITAQKQNLINNFKSVNHLASYENFSQHYLGFDFSLANFIWFCKLFFNESLEVLYDNLFYLSYLGHFDLKYIEEHCSPGEYLYFIKKLNNTLAEKQKENKANDSYSMPASQTLNQM